MGKQTQVFLKQFETRDEAARVSDRALLYLHGPKYQSELNFPDDTPGDLEPHFAAKIGDKHRCLGVQKEAWGKEKR